MSIGTNARENCRSRPGPGSAAECFEAAHERSFWECVWAGHSLQSPPNFTYLIAHLRGGACRGAAEVRRFTVFHMCQFESAASPL